MPPSRAIKFQSTLPVRGATLIPAVKTMFEEDISIHAPREGSDGRVVRHLRTEVLISIHAPREGSDFPRSLRLRQFVYFNPRSP